MEYLPKIIAVLGPTAVGKTSLAIDLAKKFNTEIISADSRQLYKEMTIGTAKPNEDELNTIFHHFINHISIHQEYDAALFAKEANECIEKLMLNHKTVVVCGGSTLYTRTLFEGIDDIPMANEEIKNKVNAIFEKEGVIGLANALKDLDPEYYQKIDKQNPRRLIRAVEVCMMTNKPFSTFLKNRNTAKFDFIKIALDLPREILYERINARCDEMLKSGLLEEVEKLYPYKGLKALQTVGYQEFFDYFSKKLSYQDAVVKFKQHTRNYAKRQLTWLRKEKDLHWFHPEDRDSIFEFINNKMDIKKG